MDSKIKALLLGVSLRWREADDGVGHFSDPQRTAVFTKALERLEICVDSLEPDTLKSMLGSGEEVVEWLVGHPQAVVRLGSWTVALESPDWRDVDFERYEWPFELNGAVEDFTKTKSGDGWCCAWCMG